MDELCRASVDFSSVILESEKIRSICQLFLCIMRANAKIYSVEAGGVG